MNAKALKIALAASVALNLFGIAGGVTAYVLREKFEAKVEDQHRAADRAPFREIIEGLDPAVRDRVRSALRESALAARPDFDEARRARREAVALSGAQGTLEAARVTALLDRSRAAELRGRQRLERDSVALLATLEPRDRAALSGILNRRGKGGGGAGGGGPQRDGTQRIGGQSRQG